MQVSKYVRVKGFLEEKKGADSGRFRVLAFKKQDQFIYDQDEIFDEFPPYGFAFARSVFKMTEYPLNSLVEFYAFPAEPSHDNDDIMRMDANLASKLLDFEVINIQEEIMITPTAINQPILKKHIDLALNHFYICHKGILYGEFKFAGDEVIPSTAREVNRYSINPKTYTIAEKTFLLEKPNSKDVDAKIECITKRQLADWFKGLIKTTTLQIDWNEWRKLIKEVDAGDFQSRLMQVRTYMEEVHLIHTEIKTLANLSEPLAKMYQQSILNIKEEIRQEYLQPVLNEKTKINKEIAAINASITNQISKLTLLKEENHEIESNNQFLITEKNRLIKDLQIHAKLSFSQSIPDPTTFDTQIFNIDEKRPIEDLSSFLKSKFSNLDEAEKKCLHLLPQLNESKAILCKHIELVINLARFTNNCKLYIQQVEADWLKFSYFLKNGLQQCWQSALEAPDMLHFLLLEDINMASIECYGKPILDMLAEIRNGLSGFPPGWPKNIWIFGVPVECDEMPSFALPLIKKSFRDWGAFPIFSNLPQLNNPDTYISVQSIYEQTEVVPGFQHEYFDA